MLSFVHVAEHSSGKHEHDGMACEICLSAKHQDYIGSGATSDTSSLRHTQYVSQTSIEVPVHRGAKGTRVTRGPPVSS